MVKSILYAAIAACITGLVLVRDCAGSEEITPLRAFGALGLGYFAMALMRRALR